VSSWPFFFVCLTWGRTRKMVPGRRLSIRSLHLYGRPNGRPGTCGATA
jgi:hypothetical protein